MVTPLRALAWLLVPAAFGLLAFALLVWDAVDSEPMEEQRARQEIEELRSRLGTRAPLLAADAAGNLVRTGARNTGGPPPAPIRRLRVMAYRAPEGRLLRADIPFWFARLKDPAIRFALRPTGIDLEKLGVSAADLRREGPGLVLDQATEAGDRYVVWTE